MDLDQTHLDILKAAWSRPDLRDAVQRLVMASVGRANVQMGVPDLLAVFDAMEALMRAEEGDRPARNENI